MSLFHTGDYAANGDAVPIWETDGMGKLTGILRTISGEEPLRRIKAAPVPADLPRLVYLASVIFAAPRVRAAQETAGRALADLEVAPST